MVAARMSIVELHRIKTLEAELVVTKSRLEKLEAHVWGVEADDDLNDIDVAVPKRRPGRPRKDQAGEAA